VPQRNWVPAFAGTTEQEQSVIPAKAGIHLLWLEMKMDPGFRRDDGGEGLCRNDEGEVFAGMTAPE